MGRLGIELSESTWLSGRKKQEKPEISFRDIPITAAQEDEADSVCDKCLAYLSYYALVFVACCVFIPAQTSFVFAATSNVFNSDNLHAVYDHEVEREATAKLNEEASRWILRRGK